MLKETTGQTIKHLREKNDLTREDLCQMIRLGGNSRTEDVQRLYKVENDKMELDDSVIETLAQLFNVNVDNIKSKEEWITAKEGAKIADCTPQTLHQRARKGEIEREKINKIYHFKKDEIKNINVRKIARSGQINFEDDYDYDYFKKMLKKLCKSKEIKRKKISEKIGISRAAFDSYFRSDNRIPSKSSFKKICNYFDVEPSFFKENKKENDWIKIEEAIEIANCSESTIYRYINKEKIRNKKEGKFRMVNKQDILKYKNEIKSNYNDFRKTEDDKTKELMSLIKSQSAKIKELNKEIEKTNKKLEGIENENNYRDRYMMDRDGVLRERINDLENLIEALHENINQKIEVEIKNDDKGFFGRLFS